MNKQKLLDQVQAARDHLDEAVTGEYEIGNLINAVSQLADVLEQVIPALAEAKATAEMCEAVLERQLD